MSRIAGNVVVFGPFLHRGIGLRFSCQTFSDGSSVYGGLFSDEKWWSVGIVPADAGCSGSGCVRQFCCGSLALVEDRCDGGGS